jgi:hypothetical protein
MSGVKSTWATETRKTISNERNTNLESDAPDGFIGAGVDEHVCSLTDEDAVILGAISANMTEAAALVAALVMGRVLELGDFPPREAAAFITDGGAAARNVELVGAAASDVELVVPFECGVELLVEGMRVDAGSKRGVGASVSG